MIPPLISAAVPFALGPLVGVAAGAFVNEKTKENRSYEIVVGDDTETEQEWQFEEGVTVKVKGTLPDLEDTDATVTQSVTDTQNADEAVPPQSSTEETVDESPSTSIDASASPDLWQPPVMGLDFSGDDFR